MASDANILYQIEARLIEVFGIAKLSGDGFLTHLISLALLDAQEKRGTCPQAATTWNAQIYDFTLERISRRQPESVNGESIGVGADASPTT
jgi:hypothetical protein